MSYDTVLDLPLKVFTIYNTNINRISAEEDTRLLKLLASVNSSESFTKTYDALQKENGTPIELERSAYVPMEEGAIEKLKRLQGGKISN